MVCKLQWQGEEIWPPSAPRIHCAWENAPSNVGSPRGSGIFTVNQASANIPNDGRIYYEETGDVRVVCLRMVFREQSEERQTAFKNVGYHGSGPR